MLRHRILAALILSILGVAVHLVIDLHRASREEAVAQFGAQQSLQARQAAHEVESYLKDCAQVVQFLSSLAAVRQRDQVRMAADFRAYLAPRKRLRNPVISVYAETGALVHSTDATERAPSCSGADFFDWARKRENQGKVFVSSRFRMGNGAGTPLPDRRFLLATPLPPATPESPELQATLSGRGVLLMTVDLEALLAEHSSVLRLDGKPNRAWILDRDGTVLLQSEHPEMVRNNIHQPDARCLRCHASFDYARQILAQRRGIIEYQLKERPLKLAAFAPIELANASWTLVVNVPYDEVTRFVRRNLRQTLLLLALVAAAFTALSGLAVRSSRLKARAEEEARRWQEQHRMEEEVRRAEECYRVLFAQSPDGIVVVDPATTMPVQFNETAHRQLGYSREEFARLRVADYDAVETPHATRAYVDQILREGRADFETQHRTKQGELRNVEVIAQTLKLADRTVLHCIYHDITERRRGVAALQESETRLHLLIDGTKDHALFLLDAGSQVASWNAGAERMKGYHGPEIIGQHYSRFFSREDQQTNTPQLLLAAAESVGRAENEGWRVRKDGSRFWANTVITALRNEDGSLRGFANITRDLTERKQAEEALRETNDYLENLLNYANAPIIVWDPRFRISRFNHAFEALTGRAAGEVIGKSLEILFPPPLVESSMELIRKTLGGERWETVEISIQHRDGPVRILLWNSATLFATDGRTPVATIAQGQDITGRKQAEEALRETNDYLENLLNYANAPIIVWDPQFRVNRFNHAFEALTGRTAGEVIGRSLEILFPSPLLERSMELIRKTSGGERWETVEISIQHRDGHIRTVLWNSATLFAADGKTPVATIAQGQDITGRKQAEEALKDSLREKEALLKEVHHRVKNNLQVISSLVRLQARQIENPVTRAALQDMQNRIRSMALLHETLYQSGNLAQVDLAPYLNSLCSQLFRSLVAHPGSIQLRLNVASVGLDVNQAVPCGLLINELVSNSLKHAFPDGRAGEVRVEVQPVEGGPALRLRVADNGVGLPADLDPRHVSSLGLQLVSDLAGQLQGRLEVGRGRSGGFPPALGGGPHGVLSVARADSDPAIEPPTTAAPGPGAVFEVLFTPQTASIPEAHHEQAEDSRR